ncbi:hypothetical protein D9M69_513750 [compost metagenome]
MAASRRQNSTRRNPSARYIVSSTMRSTSLSSKSSTMALVMSWMPVASKSADTARGGAAGGTVSAAAGAGPAVSSSGCRESAGSTLIGAGRSSRAAGESLATCTPMASAVCASFSRAASAMVWMCLLSSPRPLA